MMLDFTIDWVPMWLAHILRGLCILVGPFCMILCFRLVFLSSIAKHRKYGYAGIGFLVLGAVYTQAERWNLPVTPRLFIVTPGILLVFYALLTMRFYDTRDV